MIPSKDELVQALQEHGSIQAVAHAYQRPRTTVRDWYYRHNIDIETVKGVASPEALSVEETTAIEYQRIVAQRDELKGRVRRLESALQDQAHWSDLIRVVKAARLERPRWSSDRPHGPDTAVACAMLSDIHYGEVVEPEAIGDLNEFNKEIADRRIETYFRRVIYIFGDLVDVPVSGLVLWLLGDMISGELHMEHQETNDCTIPEAILGVRSQVSRGIAELADAFGSVHVPCVVGNHGRKAKKPQHKGKVRTNWDWLIYALLASDFEDDERVTFNVSESSEVEEVLPGDWRYLATHGDQFRGGSGISGAVSPLMLGVHRKSKRAQQADRPWDYLVIGHWHQLLWLDPLFVNGSLKGFDEYDLDKNHDYRLPEQGFWLHDARRGATIRGPIYCESARDRSA